MKPCCAALLLAAYLCLTGACQRRPSAPGGAQVPAAKPTPSPAMSAKPSFAFQLDDEVWRARLSPAQYQVLREAGTEPPGSGPLLAEKRPGVFACAGCGQELFESSSKFDSGSGWPSFFASRERAVGIREDLSHGMRREEIYCSRCGGHLGHRFDDGPAPSGQRYCVNSLSLDFRPQADDRKD